ncbi:MAG TPA: hypothetical protein VFM14_04395 [Gemmatimonadales bacterium]|nr:hypothetical protein [Gemmatimonadales bacterium]
MRNVTLLCVAGLAVVAAPALAQNRSISSRGTGSLSVPQTAAIPLYDVKFNQSGRIVTLVLVGKNPALPFTLEGQITGSTTASDLPVQITGGLRDSETRGSGRIVLTGSSVATIDLRGTGKQGAFSLQFRGDGTDTGGGGGGGPDFDTGARPLNESSIGNGTLDLSGRRYNLRDVRIRLYDNGRAELGFGGDQNVEGRGVWRRGLSGRADLTLNQWNGQRTSATGIVMFSGRSIQRINVTVPSQNVRVDFYPGQFGGGGGDNNTGARPINMSMRGSGTYEVSGRRYDLEELNIRLRDDGRAELRFDGERSVSGEGTWRRGSGGRADIDLIQWDGRRLGGNAFITFRGNEIEIVGVNVPNQNSRVEFYPGQVGGGGGDAAQPVNTSFRGAGTLRERGRNYQLYEASVRLRDDGDVDLTFNGQRDARGRGRWNPSGSVAIITITEWEGRRANGRGSIRFSRNLPNQIDLSVQGVQITFNATPQIQPR